MLREYLNITSAHLRGGMSQNADTADTMERAGGLKQKWTMNFFPYGHGFFLAFLSMICRLKLRVSQTDEIYDPKFIVFNTWI